MIAADETTFEYLRGRPNAPQGEDFEAAVEAWSKLRTDEGAEFDELVEIDASSLEPMVSWGTNPGMVLPVTARVPDPNSFSDTGDRAAAERALEYMDPRTGHANRGHFDRPCLPRLVHERPSRRPTCRRGGHTGSQSKRVGLRYGRAGFHLGETAGRGRGPRRRVQGRRFRLARGRVLDVPRYESRHPLSRRAVCIHLKSQL